MSINNQVHRDDRYNKKWLNITHKLMLKPLGDLLICSVKRTDNVFEFPGWGAVFLSDDLVRAQIILCIGIYFLLLSEFVQARNQWMLHWLDLLVKSLLYATGLCCPIPSNHRLHITFLYYVKLEFHTGFAFDSAPFLLTHRSKILFKPGWIAFFWTLWLATKKSLDFAKHSLSMTGSALSAYSSARHVRHIRVAEKVSD